MKTIEKNINYIQKDKCLGCGLCQNVCPKKAIKMEFDTEGFLMPIVDENCCINCGLCVVRCPLTCIDEKLNVNENFKEVFIALGNNNELIKKSSSGGVFATFAEYFIKNLNGYVVGSTIDDNGITQHIIINDISDLNKIQGSKYVQSNITRTYKKIENILKKGNFVFFSGTPCQVNALNKYLNHEYDNLLTIDLICHGVPSPLLFQKYYSYLKEKYEFDELTFRYKNKYEKNDFAISLYKNEKLIKRIPWQESGYYSLFVENKNFRKSCYKCPFANLNRCSDITIGDCGSWKLYTEFYPDQATSFVMLNSQKSIKYFEKLKNGLYYKRIDLSEETKFNFSLNNTNDITIRLQNNEMKKIMDVYYLETKRKGITKAIKIKKFFKSIIPVKVRENIKKKLRVN